MNVSFAPLTDAAQKLLSASIGVDFSYGSFQPPNWFCATARDDDGLIMGIVACEFRTPWDIAFNTAVFDRRCMTRRVLKAIFTALFARAARVTAEVETNNRQALKAIKRMGFVYEGFCRRGFNGVADTFVFGMLKEDCVFLPDYAGGTTQIMEMPDGLRSQAS